MLRHSLNLFSIVEEDTESRTVTSDDLASSESFTSSEQPQSNQLLPQSIPYSDSEPSSVMTTSPNGTVINDCHQQSLTNEDPLLPRQEDDETFSDSTKPNRKIGVATAVIEGTYIDDIHNVDLFGWKD